MTPEQLATITDALREAGLEDQARWLENPEVVGMLLGLSREVGCPRCRDYVHDRNCEVFQAWAKLKHPAADDAIESAHELALRTQARRSEGPPLGLSAIRVIRGGLVEELEQLMEARRERAVEVRQAEQTAQPAKP